MRRRTRKRLSPGQQLAMSRRQSGRCAICGCPLDARKMHVDHIVHFSRGGKDTPQNLRLVCSACNQARADQYA
ncbi:MAG: HNH endonuclease signature motif containing protein [Candidatus Thiodiazotropha endolucinida]